MSEEMIGSIETGNVSNSLGEASEQDMIRVSESMQKAKQMGSQIRDDQKKNDHLAKFLAFLINTIQNDDIRAMLVELFSRQDPLLMNKILITDELVAMLLPFYAYKAEELGLDNLFPSLHYAISLSEQAYIAYVRSLYQIYPFYQSLDKDTVASLVTSLLVYHGLSAVEEGKNMQQLTAHIQTALF